MSEISPFRSLMNYYPLERIATSHLLTRGLSPPGEDYHFSCITLGGYHPQETIVTLRALPWGPINP